MARAEYQIIQMVIGLLLGISLGLFFDLYRAWLNQIKPGRKKGLRAVGDILWWLLAAAWTFFWLLMLNWAELRFMIILMIALGLLIYIFILSKIFLPIFIKLYAIVLKVFRFIWEVIMQILWYIFAPIVFLSSIIYTVAQVVFKVFSKFFGFWGKKLSKFLGIGNNIGKQTAKKVKAKGKNCFRRLFKRKKPKNTADLPDDLDEKEI